MARKPFAPSLSDQLVAAQLDLLRVEASERAKALKILEVMRRDLVAQLTADDLTTFSKARLKSLLAQVTESIQTYYAQIEARMDTALDTVGSFASQHAADSLHQYLLASVDVTVPTDTFLARLAGNTIIMGASSADWWQRQGEDVAFRFANVVRQGLVAGETTENIVARVVGARGYDGIMDVAKNNARSLVHTSIMEVANAARNETYQQNADVVDGTRQVSTLDSHTTEICMAYDGAEFTLDGEPMEGTDLPYDGGVPRHWGCRSVEIPITKSFKELGLDVPEPPAGQRASADGPVADNTSFDDFLTRMGPEFQDEALGPGRAELWRQDKITLPQLLDMRGNPLTLDELKAKYG